MMYRLMLMSDTWYAVRIQDVESDVEQIEELARAGNMVVICDDLDWAKNELKIVEITIIEEE